MFQFPVPDIAFSTIIPVALVAITGLVTLILEMIAPKRDNASLTIWSLAGLFVAGAFLVLQLPDPTFETASGMIQHDPTSTVLQLILVIATAITVLFSDRYLIQKQIPFGEFFPLVLWSATGAMLMTMTNNLMMIFIGLEILSISLYVMAGMSREERKSEESAMKYFLLGAFASGFLLYGIALYYGATGTLDLGMAGIAWSRDAGSTRLLMSCGIGLILVGLGFKAGFVPFHQWTPDVYQGAPTNVTAFMATASKIGAFAALLRLLVATENFSILWTIPLSAVAIATMLFGNMLALAQKDVKRALAYSSISHAGYVLVDLIAQGNTRGQAAPSTLCYYLLSYTFMTLGSFAIISMFVKNGSESTSYSDLRGLWKRSPAAAALLGIFMFSLVGLPPTSGFVGKLFIFTDALRSHLVLLSIVLAISSAISAGYYLRIAISAFSDDAEGREIDDRTTVFGGTIQGAAVLCAVGVLAIAIFFAPLMNGLGLSAGQGREAVPSGSAAPIALTVTH